MHGYSTAHVGDNSFKKKMQHVCVVHIKINVCVSVCGDTYNFAFLSLLVYVYVYMHLVKGKISCMTLTDSYYVSFLYSCILNKMSIQERYYYSVKTD